MLLCLIGSRNKTGQWTCLHEVAEQQEGKKGWGRALQSWLWCLFAGQ